LNEVERDIALTSSRTGDLARASTEWEGLPTGAVYSYEEGYLGGALAPPRMTGNETPTIAVATVGAATQCLSHFRYPQDLAPRVWESRSRPRRLS
jgi:hypothetical protein